MKIPRIIICLITVLVLGGCNGIPLPNLNQKNSDNQVSVNTSPQAGEVAVLNSNIVINQPVSSQTVSSPLTISGRASAPTGQVVYVLVNAANQLIASGQLMVTAKAPEWGSYQGTIEFELPTTPNGWFVVLTLVEGAEIKEGEQIKPEMVFEQVRIPIQFKDYRRQEVTIYFGNTQKNPNTADCSLVYPVTREVSGGNQPIVAALGELLIGPTAEEQAAGYVTTIPNKDVKIQALDIREDVVYVDFNAAVQPAGGSCAVTAARAQLLETLKAFTESDQVVISVDGKTEDIFQP